jgi:hypothetical protein
VAALLAVAGAGCAREPRDVRAARLASERYLDALSRNDLAALRTRSTCVVPSESILGGNILRLEPLRSVTRRGLDSLAAAAAAGHRALDSLWSRAPEETADSLFLHSRLLARRHVLYRNAVRAAILSLDGEDLPDSALVRTCRARVRVRFGGPLVGRQPVDREHVLRALAAPGGRWIVFSLNLREDDPRPEPI